MSVGSCQVPFSIFDWHDRTGNRRVLVQRQVSPRFLVVRTVPRHQLPSAGFAEHDHVVETFATRGSHKSLDEWILPGCVWGGEPFLNSHRLRGGRKRVERVVAIMDQIPRRLVPRKRFAHLLGRPRRRRMRGDRHVPDAAPIVGEQHQHEHEAARHRRHHEEIRGDDLADVIAQERAPRLRGRLASTAHVFRAGRLTHVEPNFSSSPSIRGAPQRGFASAMSRIRVRMLAGTVGRRRRRRLFQVHHMRKPRRCMRRPSRA